MLTTSFSLITLYLMLCVIAEGAETKSKSLYISRALGNDKWSCDQSKPCKTIWRAVTLASRGDRIHLDGTNTDKDPYTCHSGTSGHPGIYINKSLSLIGSASLTPQIRCSEGTGLTFNGSDDAQHMNVTLSGILVNDSLVSIQNASAKIDGCKFEGNKGVKFVIRTNVLSSIEIANSTFSRNRECISVVVNSTKNQSQDTHIAFKLTNTFIGDNFLSDEGGCLSFTESPYNNQSVGFNIRLENITFSRNKFSSKGLVFLKIDNGNQNIHLQNVTFIDNSPSSGRDVLTGEGYSECIVRGTDVNISINSSRFTSQNARSFNVTASRIFLQIYNSSFCGHRVEGNGGVVSITGTDLCKFKVSNSSFVNTTAAQGGALNIQCSNACSVSFEDSNFTGNTASNGGGGAVFINGSGHVSNNTEYARQDKTGVNYSSQGEQLLQINITRCHFTNAYSHLGGGAVYSNAQALNTSVRLYHATFTNCRTILRGRGRVGGGGLFINTNLMSANNMPGNDLHLQLFVDGSHFRRCRSVGSAGIGSAGIGGSLCVQYETPIELSINNSHFISNVANYGGAIFLSGNVLPSDSNTHFIINAGEITIVRSTFSNNSVTDYGGAVYITTLTSPGGTVLSVLVVQKVNMESNSATGLSGGAMVISGISTIKIHQSRFFNSSGALSVGDVNLFEVLDSYFNSNNAGTQMPFGGGAVQIDCSEILTSVLILNTTFNNCSASFYGGAIYLSHQGNVSLEVKQCRFAENVAHGAFGGALSLSLAPDIEKSPGCINERLSTANQIDDANKFPTWVYKSHLIFEDTTFERNAGYAAGAVHLINGKATFRNCYFIDNNVATLGGHIHTAPGSASLTIEDSFFRQTMFNKNVSKASSIHTESSGTLQLYNTTMDTEPYGITGPLLLVRNGRLIEVGKHNLTTVTCPVGSQMEILSFTDQVTTQVNNTPCEIQVTTLELSCSACAGNSYSLQRGRALGTQVAPGFECLSCPFGANCSQNILAKPNFWGFKEKLTPPTLTFTMCPVGYCSPPQKTDFPEYNGCQGNRSGELCGQCREPFTETLYSTNCRHSHECNDYWFWPVALVYVSLMALYFTFKPPIVPWIKRQTLWFKKREPANEDNNFDRGYLKIVFYFYQAANLLLVSNTSQHITESKFIDIFVGLFNFQQKISSSGLICPFPGLTVVTKQLFSASHVFGTCLVIGAIYSLHWGVQKCRGQAAPSVGPYIGGILQTMLLGYTTLASVSFNLLRCVPMGSEKRLFYDGNHVCFQRWQNILIAFICTLFVPFVFVLFWGSYQLYTRTLSVGKFLLACCFPLPTLLYWSFISLFCSARNAATECSASSQMSRSFIESVLYDSFKRPEDGRKLSLGWESVMIGRRLVLIVLKTFINDPLPRLLVMSLFCVLFLLHHAFTQPFRDDIANTVETISLLSIVVFATVNVFFASFLSLAVPVNDHFSAWWNASQGVEIVILSAVPAVFGLIVVAAVLSQVCRFLWNFFWICWSWSYKKQDDEMTPILATPS